MIDPAIGEHKRLVSVRQVVQLLFTQPRAAQDQAIYSLGFKRPDGSALSLRVLVGVAQEHVVASNVRCVLDSACDAGEEGVGNVGYDQTYVLGVPCRQAASNAVGAIPQSFGDVQDAFSGLGTDLAFVIDRARHRLRRDTRFLSHVPDRNLAHRPLHSTAAESLP
jgi:hypothetical protein